MLADDLWSLAAHANLIGLLAAGGVGASEDLAGHREIGEHDAVEGEHTDDVSRRGPAALWRKSF